MWPVGGVSDCHEIEESKFVVVAGGKEAERERERERVFQRTSMLIEFWNY
jgi:hypothetical protein